MAPKSWLPVLRDALLMCRDHILNIKDAPAPKATGKAAKRTLEQATAAPPATAAPAGSPQPPVDASAAAQTSADVSAVEAEQTSDGQETKEQPAAQEQTLPDAPQQPGLPQESAKAGSSDPQADGDAAASTATVSAVWPAYVACKSMRSMCLLLWLQMLVLQHAQGHFELDITLQGF